MITSLLQSINEETVEAGFTLFDKLSGKFFLRIGIDFLSVLILIRFIYYPIYKHKDLFFTFFIFNLIIFMISFLLNKVELSMGAAFGLFAVFSMLRYRTEDISIKDMTYLFLVIAIGLITAVTKGSWDELSLLNAIILTLTFLLEGKFLMRKESAQIIVYENISLIPPARREELIHDIRQRTGINVHRVSIQKIDFLRDSAQIKAYYYED
jgi:hypothetical protein